MGKRLKRAVASVMAFAAIFTALGCNRQVFDVTYAFKTAVMKNDGNAVFIPLQKWQDYKGETVQLITNDGMAILTASYKTDFINNNQNEKLAETYAEEIIDEEGVLSYYEKPTDENENFNYQIFDFQQVFDKAIILQNDRAVIIPVAKWTDYNGEQIQVITPENAVLLLSVYHTILVRDYKSNKKAIDLAEMLVGEGGVVTDLAGNYENTTFWNKQFADLKFAYNKAIKLGDDSDCLMALNRWTDFEDGEQFQIDVINGGIHVCASFNTILINDVNGKNVTAEKIIAGLNPNFINYAQGINNNPGWFNQQFFDFNYSFQDALISNGSTGTVLPIKEWCDYDGEQLQFVYSNGVTMLSSSVDSSMFASGETQINADSISQAISSNSFVLNPNHKVNSLYNMTFLDFKYKYPYALVVNDDSIMILALDSWLDYEGGEQLQLTLLGKKTTLLSTAYDTKLVNPGKSGLSIQEIAGWFNKDGSKNVIDLTNGANGFGKFNYQIFDTHWYFNYAISVNGDTAMIIPIEKWIDYDGDYYYEGDEDESEKVYTDYTEQLQISFDGSSKIYSDNTNIRLVNSDDLEIVIRIAEGYLSENGVVKLYESQDSIRKLK